MAAKIHPDKAWFTARIRQLGLTQLSLAERVGMRKESLGRVLAGTRDISAAEALAIAAGLQASMAEVLRHLGLEQAAELKVSGRVLGDGQVSSVVDSALTAPLLGEYPTGAVGLIIEAPEGALSPYNGALLVYRPSVARSVGPEMVGRLCVIEDAVRPLPVVGVLEQSIGSQGNRVTVFGTGEVFTVKRLLRASPVLGIHMRT